MFWQLISQLTTKHDELFIRSNRICTFLSMGSGVVNADSTDDVFLLFYYNIDMAIEFFMIQKVHEMKWKYSDWIRFNIREREENQFSNKKLICFMFLETAFYVVLVLLNSATCLFCGKQWKKWSKFYKKDWP